MLRLLRVLLTKSTTIREEGVANSISAYDSKLPTLTRILSTSIKICWNFAEKGLQKSSIKVNTYQIERQTEMRAISMSHVARGPKDANVDLKK